VVEFAGGVPEVVVELVVEVVVEFVVEGGVEVVVDPDVIVGWVGMKFSLHTN
jgi:hypothetical protein